MKFGKVSLVLVCGILASVPMVGAQYQEMASPGGGNMTSMGNLSAPAGGTATNPAQIKQWFSRYDIVRKQAQMSPSEKEQADNLLSQGLSVFVPGPNKTQAQKLLTGLVSKYQIAINQMKAMPLYPETSQLHRGYYQYFTDARALFSDYLRVQDNLMVKDERTGKSIMPQLLARKANLESLEQQVKQLDGELRGQFGIAAYRN